MMRRGGARAENVRKAKRRSLSRVRLAERGQGGVRVDVGADEVAAVARGESEHEAIDEGRRKPRTTAKEGGEGGRRKRAAKEGGEGGTEKEETVDVQAGVALDEKLLLHPRQDSREEGLLLGDGAAAGELGEPNGLAEPRVRLLQIVLEVADVPRRVVLYRERRRRKGRRSAGRGGADRGGRVSGRARGVRDEGRLAREHESEKGAYPVQGDGVRLGEAGRAGREEGREVVPTERYAAVRHGGRDELGLALEGTASVSGPSEEHSKRRERERRAHLMYFCQPATTAATVMSACPTRSGSLKASRYFEPLSMAFCALTNQSPALSFHLRREEESVSPARGRARARRDEDERDAQHRDVLDARTERTLGELTPVVPARRRRKDVSSRTSRKRGREVQRKRTHAHEMARFLVSATSL